jgi:hypothetical protein
MPTFGFARRPVGRVGAQDIVAEHEAAVGDALQNGRTGRIEFHPAAPMARTTDQMSANCSWSREMNMKPTPERSMS